MGPIYEQKTGTNIALHDLGTEQMLWDYNNVLLLGLLFGAGQVIGKSCSLHKIFNIFLKTCSALCFIYYLIWTLCKQRRGG